MPTEQRLGPYHERRPTLARKAPAEQRQPRPIRGFKTRAGPLAAKNLEFVAQHQDLDFLAVAGSKTQQHQLDHAP